MIHDLPFNAVEFFRRLLSNKKGFKRLYDNRKKLNAKLMDCMLSRDYKKLGGKTK